MIKYNLQFFGGRGSSGGNKAEGNKAAKKFEAGSISYRKEASLEKLLEEGAIEENDVKLLQKDKDFSFEIGKAGSGAATIRVKDSMDSEIALLKLYYDDIETSNRMTGGESHYKTVSSALNGIRRQYKNRNL